MEISTSQNMDTQPFSLLFAVFLWVERDWLLLTNI